MKAHRHFGGWALAAALTGGIVTGVAQQPPAPAPPPTGSQPQGQEQRPAGQGGPPGGQPQTPPRRAAIPAAASSIADRPDAFYGELVTVYATIEKSLTPTAFTVDQDRTKSTGKEVVVLARRLHEPVEPNTYVTIIGEVVRADAAEIAKIAADAASGLPPEVLAQYADTPVIFANAVLTPALNDLAKFIPPPMTPEEEVLDKAMKSVGPANGALRKGVEATNAELVQKNAAILASAFADVEAFWKKRQNDEAVKIAQTARNAVATIDKAAGMGNWNEVKTQATTLGQQCAACHKQFRERLEDGSFAVRKDGR